MASLYGVTLDELVHGKLCTGTKQKESVHIGFDGIHVENEKESVHVSLGVGIEMEDSREVEVSVDSNGVRIEDGNGHIYQHPPAARWKKTLDAVISLLTLAVYLLLGSLGNLWHPGWLIFFAIPIVCSLTEAIDRRNAEHFAWPVLVTFVYLWGGLQYGHWHPLWIVFLTIPVYYIMVKAFRKTPEE